MRLLSCRNWNPERFSTFANWVYRVKTAGAPHTHDFPELFWVTDGKGWHDINGTKRRMEKGYLAIIRKEDYHNFSADEAGGFVTFVNFAFRPIVLQSVQKRFFPGQKEFFGEHSQPKREYQVQEDFLERLRLLSADLVAGAHDRLSTEAFLLGVLSMLANLRLPAELHANAPSWLAEAIRQIRIYPNFAAGVPKLVELCGRSHEHVARECRRCFKQSPREIVNKARLHRATNLVITTEKKIVDVALESGFDNLGHFYELFTKAHGMSPGAYRQRFALHSSIR